MHEALDPNIADCALPKNAEGVHVDHVKVLLSQAQVTMNHPPLTQTKRQKVHQT